MRHIVNQREGAFVIPFCINPQYHGPGGQLPEHYRVMVRFGRLFVHLCKKFTGINLVGVLPELAEAEILGDTTARDIGSVVVISTLSICGSQRRKAPAALLGPCWLRGGETKSRPTDDPT